MIGFKHMLGHDGRIQKKPKKEFLEKEKDASSAYDENEKTAIAWLIMEGYR